MQERYAYYPGCLASLSQKELDSSTRAVCAKLGVELVELESMTCCGARCLSISTASCDRGCRSARRAIR